MEAPPRFELGHRGVADLCLTTWLWLHLHIILTNYMYYFKTIVYFTPRIVKINSILLAFSNSFGTSIYEYLSLS